jgi:hypothetical protein
VFIHPTLLIFTGRAHEYEVELIVLIIVLLSWIWALPIALNPGTPPQYRSGVTPQQEYIVTNFIVLSLDTLMSLVVLKAPRYYIYISTKRLLNKPLYNLHHVDFSVVIRL